MNDPGYMSARLDLGKLLMGQVMEPHRDLMGILRGAPIGPGTLKALIPQFDQD